MCIYAKHVCMHIAAYGVKKYCAAYLEIMHTEVFGLSLLGRFHHGNENHGTQGMYSGSDK